MAKLFRKGKVKRIVAIVLGLVSVAGAAFGVNALVKYAKEEQKTIHPTFSVGGLTETGVYEETDDMIYTKDAFEAKGLEIKLDFDSNVKYQVFFYDELDKFISCTEVYTESQDISVPLEARARLEVTPIWGEDAPLEKEIKWYETAKYANQLEIRVDKRQELLEKDFTSYSLLDTEYFSVRAKTDIDAYGEFQEVEAIDLYEFLPHTDYSCMYVKVISDIEPSDVALWFRVKDADGKVTQYERGYVTTLSLDNLFYFTGEETLYFGVTTSLMNANDVRIMVYFA